MYSHAKMAPDTDQQPDDSVGRKTCALLELLHHGLDRGVDTPSTLRPSFGVRRSARCNRFTTSPVAPRLIVGCLGLAMIPSRCDGVQAPRIGLLRTPNWDFAPRLKACPLPICLRAQALRQSPGAAMRFGSAGSWLLSHSNQAAIVVNRPLGKWDDPSWSEKAC